MKEARAVTYSKAKFDFIIATSEEAWSRSERPLPICSETMACVAMKMVVIAVLKVSSCRYRYASRRKVHEREAWMSSDILPLRT